MKAVCFVNGFRKRILQEAGGLDALDNLFDIFVDPSSFMKPWEKQRAFEDSLSHEKLLVVNNKKELGELIRKHGITYFLFIGLEDSRKISEVLTLIASHNAEYGILNIRKDFFNFFSTNKSDSFLGSVEHHLEKIKKEAIARMRSIRLPAPKHLITNEPKVITYPKISRDTIVKTVNYRDYYLSVNYKERPIKEKYAVFLDQAYPDFYSSTHGIDRIIKYYTEEKTSLYYELLNSYLKHLSNKLNLKIVVCLHPNSPAHFKDYFLDEFATIMYETGKYAKFADVIVTHDSNTVSYGFMYDVKTVMLLFENAMPSISIHAIKKRAKMLGITLHQWPSEDISFEKITPPTNNRIRNFFLPNKNSTSLINEIEQVVRNS